jgi:CHAT domain-containing protein
MATLWRVDDRASVPLMKHFYGRLSEAGNHRDAASALAFAQRALRRSPQLGHPYYWAAYVVVGQDDANVRAARQVSGRTS